MGLATVRNELKQPRIVVVLLELILDWVQKRDLVVESF